MMSKGPIRPGLVQLLCLAALALLAGCAQATPRAPAAPTLAPGTTAGPTGTETATVLASPTSPPTAAATLPLLASPTATRPPAAEPTEAPAKVEAAESPLVIVCSPLAGYERSELVEITSRGFSAPREGKDDGHHGTDFAHWNYKDRDTLEGIAVQSVLAGIVAGLAVDSWPYGNMIIVESRPDQLSEGLRRSYDLDPGESLYLLYSHMQPQIQVEIGQVLACGQEIGLVGNTGNSGNPHLHVETRTGPSGARFEGMVYYTTLSSDIERENYARWRFGGDFIPLDPMVLLVP